ncbi:hypothetical protein M2322_002658 [Rhodoblastus acidophilus]|uniref:hypothetical protein n=1 Tax=Rhodoblastus acidophilus TaxID=1074 RepID=UPI00222527CB|nr:hypothetical protein [Rhodoblastus acidophilus]MCW2317104.1 hypothetical protein [Rhodoblastus acidophilus]
MAKTFKLSPFGTFEHPWVNKPDTKFNSEGVFKTGHIVGGPEAIAHKELIDAEAQAAFDRFMESDEGKKLTPKQRKEWSVYVPYEEETDDNDNPTGYIKFDYKQNSKIKLKSGEVKDIKIGIKDSKSKDMHAPVWSGSEGRVMFSFRDIPMKSLKQVGVRMDFAAIQVTKLKQGGAGEFGEVEGGYTEEDQEHANRENGADTDQGGDY